VTFCVTLGNSTVLLTTIPLRYQFVDKSWYVSVNRILKYYEELRKCLEYLRLLLVYNPEKWKR